MAEEHYITIETSGAVGPVFDPDELIREGRQRWRGWADAICSLGIQHTFCVRLVPYPRGHWTIRLSRRDGGPVTVPLDGKTVAEWLAEERRPHLDTG